ncbi:MAG: hypothetical protein R3A52_32105 [Polyangiales bacterium]
MSDPRRWVEDADAPTQMRSLLADARPPRAMSADERAAMTQAAARAATSSALPLSTAAWASLVAGVAVTVVSASLLLHRAPRSDVARPRERVTETPSAIAPVVAPPSEGPTPAPRPIPPRSPTSVRRARIQPRRTAARATPTTAAPTEGRATLDQSLAAESVADPRSLLVTAPAAALATLEAHATRFERPRLVEEREFMVVEALRRLGRHAEANTRARALLARAPASAYARRLREVDGGGIP